jgi:hypothetical protein
MADSAKLYKRFTKVLLNTLNTCVSIMKIAALSRPAPSLPKANTKKCIVLGNGPSLRKALDSSHQHFEGTSLIAVNGFALSGDYMRLRPRYYVLLDPGIWNGEQVWIDNMVKAIADNTSWELHVMIPRQAKRSKRMDILTKNRNIQIHYLNYVVYKGWNVPGYFFWKRNLAMPQCHNVLVAALFLAINFGYKEIELAGADHNWHETLAMTENNILSLKHIHFYDKEERISYQPFYKGAASKETFRIDEIFYSWAHVFYGYWRIKEYADYLGTQIFNISDPSYVDAFERKKLK